MKAFAFGAGAVLVFVLGVSSVAPAQEEVAAPGEGEAPPPTTAVEVTDKDRTVASFTREAATVGDGILRVELQGFTLQDDDDPDIDIRGFPLNEIAQQQGSPVTDLSGGFIELLGSYGLGNLGEVGLGIPYLWQKLDFESCSGPDGVTVPCTTDQNGFGDMTMYAKATYQALEHLKVAGGVELSLPTGSEKRDLGTGELGVNPFVSTRYQYGPAAAGLFIGYNFFTGDVDNMLNYGGQLILRALPQFLVRGEIVGTNFTAFGQKFNDANAVFGLDFIFNEYFTIRPTGIANITGDSMGWGVGLGLVGQYPIFE